MVTFGTPNIPVITDLKLLIEAKLVVGGQAVYSDEE